MSTDDAKVRELARAEAESIATRWVPAHMTARQGLVDDITASLVRYRAIGRDEGWERLGDMLLKVLAPAATPTHAELGK